MRYIEIKDHGYIYRREFEERYKKDQFNDICEPAEDEISCEDALDACCMLLRACYSGKKIKEALEKIKAFEYGF